ncbi:Rieske (2Fe-2S) protein [Iodobacter fluviatilis]|jgi:nitrite reductase/ring-hydroxylating ferredoxin subunit|uniref:(2Fe-2S)-binding protein n=1 Tax=Iodobacter fluviatilis TaxID=537 RepID=A0A7G3GCT6_9NEIS|nr:Rieske 2Fe-2S domain-containing protein [Iodobacter fluviatilis]QBC44988.1 (2Fe-2S)-binding protein [Iodobacter fluviatilis]
MPDRVLCQSGDLLERGLAQRFTLQWGGRERSAFVLRYDGRVYAYINECAHIPIEMDFNPGDLFDLSRSWLVCSTHGAYYAPNTGLCLGGPCPGRKLISLPVREIADQVCLIEDKTQHE